MPKFGPDRIRNVAILGHSHEGKTTLAEAMLHATGALPRMGSTDAGTAALDYEPEEQRRKISIDLGLASAELDGYKVNLLDSPGFLDFAGQAVSALAVAEAALLVTSATGQLSVGTELAWTTLNELALPRLVVVNKMDKENADYFGALDAMRAELTPKPVALHLPIGAEGSFRGVIDLMHQKAFLAQPDGQGGEGPIPADMRQVFEQRHEQLIEAAAEGDDVLLEKYLEEGTLSDAEVEQGLRAGIRSGRVAPVVCCSATKLLGVRTLLRAVCDLLPAPDASLDGPASALVFSTHSDPFGRVSFFKILAGCLKSEQTIENRGQGATERLAQLFFPRGKEHVGTPEACAGDIAGATKLTHTRTGDLLGNVVESAPSLQFPVPRFRLAIEPRSRGDEDKISNGLARLAEEDPSLQLVRDEETQQMLIAGLGDVHIEVALAKLKRRYQAEAVTAPPRIGYRETISRQVRAEGRHVKQSGGHGQYAICVIEASPAERGAGFEWEDKIFGGSIPINYRPSVRKGIEDTMARGAVAGYPMVDVRVRLVDGKFHTVDSSDMAFQIAGSLALRKAAAEAAPVLLEPVMQVQVRVPERYLGELMSDLNAKRGHIAGTDSDGGSQLLTATVPQGELQRFTLDLRSLSQGRGSFEATFSHYEPLPPTLARPLIEAWAKEHGG